MEQAVMMKKMNVVDVLPESVSWALQHAPELAADAWLAATGNAPRSRTAVHDPLAYARSAARRNARPGFSRGVSAVRMGHDAHRVEDVADAGDPLALLLAAEAIADRAEPVDSCAAPRPSHLTPRRLQQLAAHRRAASEAGQLGFPGFGFAAEELRA